MNEQYHAMEQLVAQLRTRVETMQGSLNAKDLLIEAQYEHIEILKRELDTHKQACFELMNQLRTYDTWLPYIIRGPEFRKN